MTVVASWASTTARSPCRRSSSLLLVCLGLQRARSARRAAADEAGDQGQGAGASAARSGVPLAALCGATPQAQPLTGLQAVQHAAHRGAAGRRGQAVEKPQLARTQRLHAQAQLGQVSQRPGAALAGVGARRPRGCAGTAGSGVRRAACWSRRCTAATASRESPGPAARVQAVGVGDESRPLAALGRQQLQWCKPALRGAGLGERDDGRCVLQHRLPRGPAIERGQREVGGDVTKRAHWRAGLARQKSPQAVSSTARSALLGSSKSMAPNGRRSGAAPYASGAGWSKG